MWICFVVTPVWYKVSHFFGLFLYLLQKPKHLFKENMLSKLLKVIVYIRVASKSAFEGFKMLLHTKLSFLHTLFLEKEAQIDQNNHGTMLLGQNKSVCQKLARSSKKWKSAKNRYTPFLLEGLQLVKNW